MSARCPGCKAVVVVPYPPVDHRSEELLLAPFSSSANDTSNRSPLDEIELPDVQGSPAPIQATETDKIAPIESIQSIAPIQIDEPQSSNRIDPVNEFELNTASPGKAQQNTHLPSPEEAEIRPDLSQLSVGESENKPTLSAMAAIEKRSRQAKEDRITLTRFFAGFLIVVGLINLAPAVYCWWQWSQADGGILLPRWIYLQIFAAILHIVYAVLLVQVPDWSTLLSIAIVMLVFAFIFGLFSVGLVANSNGLLSQFLQIPGSLGRKACIWCVAMLVLATLASYLAGRESTQWRRTETLLAQVLAKSRAVS